MPDPRAGAAQTPPLPRLTFLGGAGEVTGSCYLVETAHARFIVDCGLFQGGRDAETKNRRAFAFDPRSLDFVLLTHAHIDHSGLLPRLAAQGFSGPIHCTAASADLAAVMLRDSAHIQQKEAQWRQEHAARARAPGRSGSAHAGSARDARRGGAAAEPLYTLEDAERAIALFRRHRYGESITAAEGVTAMLRDAGHILGSATIEVRIDAGAGQAQRTVVFSGDLGQPGHPVVRDAVAISRADTLLIESTYGNRLHRTLEATLDELVEAMTDALETRRGNVIIPAFAVGRTQDLLLLFLRLTREGRLPAMDIYVDSPLATTATEITLAHLSELDAEAQELARALRRGATRGKARIRFSESVEDSIRLNDIRHGAVIISASGMCDAGRIKHHLRNNLPRSECSVVITGFQAQGTLGRRLVDGARRVRLFGEEVAVRAKIYTIGGLSAHADQGALLGWLAGFTQPPEQTWVVHGEAGTAEVFAQAVRERMHWPAQVAAAGQQVAL
jgi:metallo-beta-lactamase family protein